MVKKSFTLVEIIFVIVIMAVITLGSFKMLKGMFERYYQSNTITSFSVTSQALLDEISQMLYFRVSLTAIGYNPSNGDFKKLDEIDSDDYTVFEWIAEGFDAKLHIMRNIHTGYSGFIDLDASDKDTLTLVAKDFNVSDVNKTEQNIFQRDEDLNETVAVIFAGKFDKGDESATDDYKNAYGYHGHDHKKVFTIHSFKQGGVIDSDANLSMNDEIKNNKIYSKYYLADTAYAVSRGEGLDIDSPCISALNIDEKDINDTLLLFYNYRPWRGDTFCGDTNETGRDGNVTILGKHVTSFRVSAVGYHIELKVQLEKPIYKGSDKNITVTKQKVAF